MKPSCVLMAIGKQGLLRSLKTLLEPHVEVSAMTDNILSMLDAIEVLEPDLAVIQMTIPDREHMNLMRHLRSRFPELKLIVVGNHSDSVVLSEVLNEGVQGYVFQHKAEPELLSAIDEVLRGGTYVSATEGQEGEHLADRFD